MNTLNIHGNRNAIARWHGILHAKTCDLSNTFVFISERYMPKFVVSLSNDKPVTGKSYDFSEANVFTKCGDYLTQPPASASVVVSCTQSVKSQYVYVHAPGTAYIQICDVAVYGKGEFPITVEKISTPMHHQPFSCVFVQKGINKYLPSVLLLVTETPHVNDIIWPSNNMHMLSKVWGGITYPFPNFNCWKQFYRVHSNGYGYLSMRRFINPYWSKRLRVIIGRKWHSWHSSFNPIML